MTFTYLDPQGRDQDAVRFEIGDTIERDHQVEDEDILYALEKEGENVCRAAARICEALAARYAAKEVFRAGTFQSQKTSIATKYLALARRLRARAIGAGAFIVPSISVSTKSSYETDTDIPQPAFKRGLHDNEDGD
jgi:hypothetical protein